ncbi:MAG: hypothetical protein HYV35_07575 [Lentisphaerae bacterium]|nr:hypothetical protein [Lentisphaerota bacterium]
MSRQKYDDGTEIHVGERVFYHGQAGRIVIVAAHGEYAPDYPKEEWSAITTGLMIHFDNGAILHLELPDNHFSKNWKESWDGTQNNGVVPDR